MVSMINSILTRNSDRYPITDNHYGNWNNTCVFQAIKKSGQLDILKGKQSFRMIK